VQAELFCCMKYVSCHLLSRWFPTSSTLKMETKCSSETSNGLHGVISQTIELFKYISLCASYAFSILIFTSTYFRIRRCSQFLIFSVWKRPRIKQLTFGFYVNRTAAQTGASQTHKMLFPHPHSSTD
jgi:hypothetical protein